MRDEVKDLGYDREQEYFHRKEKELLEKRRKEQEAQSTAEEARELKERHWMRCPRCGHEMAEEELSGIQALRCGHCAGVYFEASELERIQEAQEPGGVIAGLKRWLGR
jgi:uncharacterized protein